MRLQPFSFWRDRIYTFSDTFLYLWHNLCILRVGLDIKSTSGCNISKFDNNGNLNGWRTVGNWICIEGKAGKYPKDRVLGE